MDLLKSGQLNIITLDRGKEFSKHADLSGDLDKAAFCFLHGIGEAMKI